MSDKSQIFMKMLLGSVDEILRPSYEARRVRRTAPGENRGIGLSTCWVDDFECYETALLVDDPACETPVIVVERYASEQEASLGHDRWVEAARTLDVVTFLGPPGLEETMNCEIDLARWRA